MSTSPKPPDINDLLEALAQVVRAVAVPKFEYRKDEGWFTTQDYASHEKICRSVAIARLKKAEAEGAVERLRGKLPRGGSTFYWHQKGNGKS